MSSLIQHAKSELRRAGLFDPDADFDGAVATCVVTMMEVFTAYGHSGGSSEITLNVFARVARHLPLTPLTGEDSEWIDMTKENSGDPLWQNNRCHSVFKDRARAWIVRDKSKSESKGAHPGDGRVNYITFPYTVE